MMPTEEDIENASSLSDIEILIAGCTRCPLFSSKNCDVSGSGNIASEIMFIGEAPGKKEDELGIPFVGAAGRFLDEMLAETGLSRDKVFITNLIKHRPPKNRDPVLDEIQACWPYLKKQIEIINPCLIVFLGRHALNRLFPELKISEVHGEVFSRSIEGRKYNFLPLYHPAAALYNGGMRPTQKLDFKKITTILKKIKRGEKK
jgi:uracil-DNA glycosylase